MGSTRAILSRSFCNAEEIGDVTEIEEIFQDGVAEIRCLEEKCQRKMLDFEDNRRAVVRAVQSIVGRAEGVTA